MGIAAPLSGRLVARLSRLAWPSLVGLLILVAGPALWAPTQRFIGAGELDAYGTQWFFWFVSECLQSGLNPGWTDLLFYPWGKDVYLHTGGNLLDAYMSVGLRWIFGPVLGFNLWILLVLAGNACGAERIAAAVGADGSTRWAAAALGLLIPSALFEIDAGRPTQGMMLFSALWMASLLRPPSWKQGVAGGLFLALSAHLYWYWGLIGAAVGGLAWMIRMITGPTRGQECVRMAVAVAVCALLVMPFAWPMLTALETGEVPGLLALGDASGPLGRIQLRTVEGDLQSLFVMAANGRGGGLLDSGGLRFAPGPSLFFAVHFLIAVIGILATRGTVRWIALAWLVGVGLIAAGPVIVWGDSYWTNHPYVWVVEQTAILRRWWWPGRAVAYLHLVTIVLFTGAVMRLELLWRFRTMALVLFWVLLSGFQSGRVPLNKWDAYVSSSIRCVRDAAPGAVLDIPYAVDQKHLYYQTIHQRPIFGGMLVTKDVFIPKQHGVLRQGNPWLRALIAIGKRKYVRPAKSRPVGRGALADLGYRYVLVRKDAFRRARPQADGSVVWEPEWPRARRSLKPILGPPALEDDDVAIYSLDGRAIECP